MTWKENLILTGKLIKVKFNTVYLTGDGTRGSGDKSYIHVQGTPSKNWIIVHNMDKRPSVSVVDETGEPLIVFPKYPNNNTVILEMNATYSGKAYLN